VANIGDLLLASFLSDIVYLSWQVVLTQLGKAEIEELFLLGVWVESFVYS
jgi:hypothetical protein